MSIKIEHRNLEIRKTRNDFSVPVRNFLLPLSLKVLRHKERDTHSLYSGFFICPPPSRTAPATKATGLASASKRKPNVFSRGRSNSTNWLFQNPQNPPRASGAWRHPHSVAPVSHLGYCDISEWHVRSAARAWTPVLMLHLSNPCTEPKGSQPN